ncbi:MAG: pentapeptide repeat-containing protein, partial [Alphaproteobacteria bacterium]|nr:pentapeptide repeat-containing protein [Alphaproteobacteria bacterium]
MLSDRARQARLARARRREAKQAPDLARHINSVNDTARQCATHYAGFLFLAGGLFILISGTTHEDLLRETPVQMPLFNIGVPLKTFYVLAPLIFLILHVNLLNKLAQLRTQFQELGPPEARPGLRTHLFQFDYALLLGGFVGKFSERVVLGFIVGLTLFVMPVMLLIYAQYKFLPYHSDVITWWHRCIVTFDMCVLIFFHVAIAPAPTLRRTFFRAASTVLCAIALFTSWGFLTPPDRLLDRWMGSSAWNMAEKAIDLKRNISMPATYLRNVQMQGLLLSDAQTKEAGERTLRDTSGLKLSGRDLRYADLSGADLRGASLATASLQNAMLAGVDLSFSDIRGTDFSSANLRHAKLVGSIGIPWKFNDNYRLESSLITAAGGLERSDHLEEHEIEKRTSFEGAILEYADLSYANLSYALLSRSNLFGSTASSTMFREGDLQYANLASSQMKGANFVRAKLGGGRLESALMQGAVFVVAEMRGTNLYRANLVAADFSNADLSGANLSYARLYVSKFEEAKLIGTSLYRAYVVGGDFSGANLTGAYFRETHALGAIFSGANLQSADFRYSALSGAQILNSNLTLADFSDVAVERPIRKDFYPDFDAAVLIYLEA